MTRRASGLRAWVLQRISAIYLLLFFPYLIAHFLVSPAADYEAWQGWVTGPLVSVATLVFFLALLLHAWVGIRDILIDYVHPDGPRLLLLSLFGVGLIACGLWALQILVVAQAL